MLNFPLCSVVFVSNAGGKETGLEKSKAAGKARGRRGEITSVSTSAGAQLWAFIRRQQ